MSSETLKGVPHAGEELRQRIAFLGARPFHHQVVQSPWNAVVDVEGLRLCRGPVNRPIFRSDSHVFLAPLRNPA